MTAALNHSVLVLNRHWLAIHICSVRRALCLLYADLARVVDESYRTHDFDSWRELSAAASDPEMIRTPSFSLCIPQVIMLTRYSRRPPQQRPDWTPPPQQQPRRNEDGMSDSVRRVEQRTRGQVLSAEPVPYDGRNLNRIKVVDERGRVRVYMDDPQQGAQQDQAPTRDNDD